MDLRAVLSLCSVATVLAAAWPPPIAPVWPTRFTAHVHGESLNRNISHETGVWYYDWPKNIYRADYDNHFKDGTSRRDTQLWNATIDHFYVFMVSVGQEYLVLALCVLLLLP